MVLTTFCPKCDAEKSIKSKGAENRDDFVAITGSEMVGFTCNSCKQSVSVHINDVNAEEGYLMFYLIPIIVLLFGTFIIFKGNAAIYIILAPITFIGFVVGRRIYHKKMEQVATFNAPKCDRPPGSPF